MTFGSPPVAEPPATAEPAAPADEPPAAEPAAPDDGFETFAAPGAAAPPDAATPDARDAGSARAAPSRRRRRGLRDVRGARRGRRREPRAGGAATPARPTAPRRPTPRAPADEPAEKAFDTYVAPPPLRPPTEEPKPPEPEPEPAPEPELPPRSLDDEDAGPATAMPRALDGDAGAATAMPQSVGTGGPGAPPEPPRSLDEEPEPREPRERRNLAFPLAIGAALVVAVVLGLLLGGGGGDDPDPARGAGEHRARAAGAVGRDRARGAQGLAGAGDGPGDPRARAGRRRRLRPRAAATAASAVEFGMVDADDSTLLLQGFRKQLGLGQGEVPERTAVKLGPDDIQAYRYAGLQPEGFDRTVTLYAAPTSAGVATVACMAPAEAAEGFGPECEGIADTLQVSDAKAFPVGPDPAYAKTVNRTLNQLDRRVAAGRKALGRDGATFRAQARAAGNIQAAYADAAKQLSRAETSPADRTVNQGLVDSLTASKEAWKKAASAASDKNKGGFERSSAGIRRTQQQLAAQLGTLEAVGYTLDR